MSTGHKRVRASKEHAGDFTYDAQGESIIKWANLDDSQTGSSAAITSSQKIRQLPHHGRVRFRKRLTVVVYGGVDHALSERSERVSAGSSWLTSSSPSELQNKICVKGALLCDVSPVQIHSLVANLLLSPRLCETSQIRRCRCSTKKLSESSGLWNFVCSYINNQSASSCYVISEMSYVMSRAKRKVNCLHSISILKGKLSLVSNDTVVAFLWLVTLRSFPRKDYMTNQTNAYKGNLWVVQKYNSGEGLCREFCPRAKNPRHQGLAEKRHNEVIEIKNQGNAGHKTKDNRAFLEWFWTNNNIIVSLMNNKSYDMYLFFIYIFTPNIIYCTVAKCGEFCQ